MPIREGFFAFVGDIGVQNEGFMLFGGAHIAMLGGLAIIIAAICYAYKKQNGHRRSITIKIIALTILSLEIIKQISLPALQGRYWVEQLPLHLCGLSIAIDVFHAFYPNKTTGEILYSLGLPGALAALIYPNWTMYPMANFYSLQSFMIHALHIALPLMLLLTGEIRPDAKRLWRVVAFLAVAVPPIYFFNIRHNTNFFFINAGSEGSPLEIFVNWLGFPGFLLPYAGLVAVIWLMMYLPWAIAGKKSGGDIVRTN
jgi:hypothetical integral membrane protein (TIGR02206 family)